MADLRAENLILRKRIKELESRIEWLEGQRSTTLAALKHLFNVAAPAKSLKSPLYLGDDS
jgi:hypothetical protein